MDFFLVNQDFPTSYKQDCGTSTTRTGPTGSIDADGMRAMTFLTCTPANPFYRFRVGSVPTT